MRDDGRLSSASTLARPHAQAGDGAVLPQISPLSEARRKSAITMGRLGKRTVLHLNRSSYRGGPEVREDLPGRLTGTRQRAAMGSFTRPPDGATGAPAWSARFQGCREASPGERGTGGRGPREAGRPPVRWASPDQWRLQESRRADPPTRTRAPASPPGAGTWCSPALDLGRKHRRLRGPEPAG